MAPSSIVYQQGLPRSYCWVCLSMSRSSISLVILSKLFKEEQESLSTCQPLDVSKGVTFIIHGSLLEWYACSLDLTTQSEKLNLYFCIWRLSAVMMTKRETCMLQCVCAEVHSGMMKFTPYMHVQLTYHIRNIIQSLQKDLWHKRWCPKYVTSSFWWPLDWEREWCLDRAWWYLVQYTL